MNEWIKEREASEERDTITKIDSCLLLSLLLMMMMMKLMLVLFWMWMSVRKMSWMASPTDV